MAVGRSGRVCARADRRRTHLFGAADVPVGGEGGARRRRHRVPPDGVAPRHDGLERQRVHVQPGEGPTTRLGTRLQLPQYPEDRSQVTGRTVP